MDIAWGTDNNLYDDQFYNREEEIGFLKSILNTSQFGSTPTILLTGIRGVGKTALLKKLQREFIDDYLVIYADFSQSYAYQTDKLSPNAIMEFLYDRIIKSAHEQGLKTLGKKLEKYFKTNDFHIKEILNFQGISIPIPKSEENYHKLADFVMDLPQMIYDEYSEEIKGVFIFIDEFQTIKDLDNELNGFLWYFRSKVQEQKNVAYMFSGSMSLTDSLIQDIAGKKGAFGGRMLTYELKPFSKEITKNYLDEKADNLKFSDRAFERFYTCTKGIPTYINLFAKLLPQNHLINEEELKEEFKKDLPFLAIHFINIWSKLTFKEQKIIISLLDKPLKRVEIARELNVTSGSLSNSLNSLQNKALIQLNDSKYEIIDYIFRAWLKNEYANKGVYPFRSI